MSEILLTEIEIRKIIRSTLLKETLASGYAFGSAGMYSVDEPGRRRDTSSKESARRTGSAMDCYFCEDKNAADNASLTCNGGIGSWDVVDDDFEGRVRDLIGHADLVGFGLVLTPVSQWRSEEHQLKLFDDGETPAAFGYHCAINQNTLRKWKRASLAVDMTTTPANTTEVAALNTALDTPTIMDELDRLEISVVKYPTKLSHVHFQDKKETIAEVETRYRRGEQAIVSWARRSGNCERDELD